ncbi:Ig-like domain-containing protein [Anoxybacillus gonensis]|uniref:Ig-like domain-containing protein n=1 Tax=Anoxybacillus gonensis TaxID=198467 RepID=UPI0002BF55A9|nr:Ig-like domain-containing protein [Anoxybacillus gonensis]EMI10429.1 SgtA precursor [Anoxybacillus gonensis]
MDKKKAIKIVTASTIAASAFVTANPYAFEASTNVDAVVKNAKTAIKGAYLAYNGVVKTGKLVDVKVVQEAIKKADAEYKKAVAEVKKNGGKKKDALLADLEATYKTYVTNGAKKYVAAYPALTALNKVEKLVNDAVATKDLAKVKAAYDRLVSEVKKAQNATKAVYGSDARAAFVKSANATIASLKNDTTAYVALTKAQDAVSKEDFATAQAMLDKAAASLAKATSLKAELTALNDTVKASFEEKAGAVKEVSAVADVTVNEGETVTLPEKVEVTLANGKKVEKAVTWESKDLTKPGEYTLNGTFEGTELKATVKVVVKAVAPKVESVSAINLKEVVITFNKPLTEEQVKEAGKVSNYGVFAEDALSTNLMDGAGAYVTVANDKKSVTLLLENGATLSQGKTKNKVTVSKNLGLATDYSNTEVASSDVAVPQLTSVEIVGNKTIKLYFSEAVNNLATLDANKYNYSISADGGKTWKYLSNQTSDDSKIQVANITASDDKRSVTIELNEALPTGDYKISTVQANVSTANQLADFAGYKVADTTKDFKVVTPTTVAQASKATVNNRTEVVVEFDAPVLAGGTLQFKDANGVTKSTTSVTKVSDTKLKYTFANADAITVGKVEFTVSGVTDAYGYSVPTKVFKDVDVVADASATAAVKVTDDDTIEVVFSKKMQNNTAVNSTTTGDASNKAHYVIKDKDGKVVDLTGVTATYSEDAAKKEYKTVLTKANWNLAPGNYTISITGLKDYLGQAATEVKDQAIAVTDTTKPAVSGITASAVNGQRKITITFPEAMATSGPNSITNKDNYAYAADGSNFVALPDGTSLVAAADGKSVTITLPDSATAVATTASKIQIGRTSSNAIYTVADAAGNIQDTLPGVFSQVVIAADAAPSIDSQATTVVDANTLKVAVTGGKIGTVSAGDFKYTVDGSTWKSVASAELVSDASGNQYIQFKIGDTLSAKVDRTKVKVKVDKASPDTKSALGSAIANGEMSSTPAATLTAWPFRASITSAEVLDPTHIKVTFDGLVGSIGATNTPDTLEEFLYVSATNTSGAATVYNGFDGTLNGSTEIQATRDGSSSVILTLGSPIDTSKEVKVKTYDYNLVAASQWAKDANGVPYNTNTTGVVATVNNNLTVVDVTPTVSATSGIFAQNDTIEILFSKVVDPATIKSGWDGSSITIDLDISADGKLTSSTANFGTIEGFTVPNALTDLTTKATMAIDASGKKLTITFKDESGSNTISSKQIVANGKLTFKPNANIATPFGEKIATTNKDTAVALDSEPVLYRLAVTNDDTPGTPTLTAGDKITLTFSEPVRLASGAVLGDKATNDTFVALSNATAVSADADGFSKTWVITLATGDLANIGFNASGSTAIELKIVDSKVTDTGSNPLSAPIVVAFPESF